VSGRRDPPLVSNAWGHLRRHAPARIAQGRCGVSLPTGPHLDLLADHARARDAVHRELGVAALSGALRALGFPVAELRSEAADRQIYLKRPDLGRRLTADGAAVLRHAAAGAEVDVAVVVADGLSALAVERHAAPFLERLQRVFPGPRGDRALGPVAIVRQGRVAVGDDVGEALGAKAVIVLIGERPGLSSPDSMGLYLTWAPRRGRVDAERNCISNIRPEGLDYEASAGRAAYLLREAFARRLSGVDLKDESPSGSAELDVAEARFLLPPG
jgi:ethanolamine ammonia-lyase small subunit